MGDVGAAEVFLDSRCVGAKPTDSLPSKAGQPDLLPLPTSYEMARLPAIAAAVAPTAAPAAIITPRHRLGFIDG